MEAIREIACAKKVEIEELELDDLPYDIQERMEDELRNDWEYRLTYHVAGSPLSGSNKCSCVHLDGSTCTIVHNPFIPVGRSFIEINSRCEAYSLEEVAQLLNRSPFPFSFLWLKELLNADTMIYVCQQSLDMCLHINISSHIF